MKRKRIYYISALVTSVLVSSCGSSKATYTEQEIESLHELVANKSFEIESEWAYPLPSNALNSIAGSGLLPPGNNANQISLIGNANFLKIEGDSIEAQLPYYGERRFPTTYNSNNVGIKLNGLLKNLDVNFNEEKKRYEIRFQANQDTENYDFTVNIFPNGKTYMNVNSTHRTNIAYRGDLKSNN